MKYLNAAEILPEHLISEIQQYIRGELIYIPSSEERIRWGEKNGTRHYYHTRNIQMKAKFQKGSTIEEISLEYGLSYETVKKIIYRT